MVVNVLKIGGNVIDNELVLQKFLADFSRLSGPKVLIHGGGKIATKIAAQLGVKTQMVEGRRITDEAMRDVVVMVYGGLINKKIVSGLQTHYCNAIGLSGADANVVKSIKRPVKTIDYGYVGDIESVNVEFIESLLSNTMCPVFAPLSNSVDFGILNTNADTLASTIAVSLSKKHQVNLVYCFEKKGVLLDINDEDSVINTINPEKYIELKQANLIFEGMIPKLDNAFDAINAGVSKVIICHADEINETLEKGTTGTHIMTK